MKRLILVIGILTYSSVGWSDTHFMKCDLDIQPGFYNKRCKLFEYFKLETDESSVSEELLMRRGNGYWENICDIGQCEKSGSTVRFEMVDKDKHLKLMLHRVIYDFGQPQIEIQKLSLDGSKLITSSFYRCQRI